MSKWEMKMHEQRELRKKGAAILHRRVQLLVECYEDTEFQSYCYDNDLVDIDFLDAELVDTAANFLTLMAVYKRYPSAAEWEEKNVRVMIAEVMMENKKPRVKPEDSPERHSWKERALKAESECERLRAENHELREELEFLRSKGKLAKASR